MTWNVDKMKFFLNISASCFFFGKMLRCSSNLSANNTMTSNHPLTNGAARANSQPGHVGFPFRCWDPGEKPDEPGVTSKRPRQKNGSETVPLMLGGGDSWGRWGAPEASYKTDYLDLVGAYLVSHMITCSTAAKWFVVKDFLGWEMHFSLTNELQTWINMVILCFRDSWSGVGNETILCGCAMLHAYFNYEMTLP